MRVEKIKKNYNGSVVGGLLSKRVITPTRVVGRNLRKYDKVTLPFIEFIDVILIKLSSSLKIYGFICTAFEV